jgi:hypothetical protein
VVLDLIPGTLANLGSATTISLALILIWRVRKIERAQKLNRQTNGIIIKALLKKGILKVDDLADDLALARKNGQTDVALTLDHLVNAS